MAPQRRQRYLLMHLKMLSLLLCVCAWYVAAAPTTYDRVDRITSLDVPLTELLMSPLDGHADAMDLQLQQAIAECRMHGISGAVQSHMSSMQPLAVDREQDREQDQRLSDVRYCHRLRYVRHVRQHHRTVLENIDKHSQQPHRPDHEDIPSVEVRDSEELAYQSFFESYAQLKIPVSLQLRDEHPHASDTSITSIGLHGTALDEFLAVCFASTSGGHTAALLVESEACAALLQDHFQVPLVAVNSYVPRTNVSLSPVLLPSLLRIQEQQKHDSHRGAVSCPFGLHTLLVPLSIPIDLCLYDAHLLPSQLPMDSYSGHHQDYSEVRLTADASASTSISRTDHLTRVAMDAMAPLFRHQLAAHHTLFVPSGTFATATSHASSRVLRFCFVDASNLNSVTETLRVDALVNEDAASLLVSLLSSSLDTSMMRRPTPRDDALWSNFMQWPKENKKLRKRREMVVTTTDDATGDATAVPLSRRERLKLWQDDKRWAWHIASLTLPVPLPPVVINTTRHSVTLRWQDLYERPKHDITAYGYEVRWTREQLPSGETEAPTDALPMRGAVNFTHTQLVRSAMPTTLFGDAFDGKDIEGVVVGLVADATYAFTVRVYVGDTLGVASDRSLPARTAPCAAPDKVPGVVSIDRSLSSSTGDSTCVQLRWLSPGDDGGRDVTSYVFALRPLLTPLASLHTAAAVDSEDEQLSGWERLASVDVVSAGSYPVKKRANGNEWLTGQVCGQIPQQVVEIRVAAVNSIGVSDWSDPSGPIPVRVGDEVRTMTTIPTVRGRGDPAHLNTAASVLTNISAAPPPPPPPTSRLPRAILSDVLEKIVVAGEGTTESQLSVWAGHFSPRRFHVSSELVLADPLDASQSLRNQVDVRNRIVVVTRGGGVPFVTKVHYAQLAGALGVVIIDSSAQCVRGFDQRCVAGSSKSRAQGFGASDRHPLWRQITIPFVLAMPDALHRIQDLLDA